jgi:hypothetical protein
MQVHERPASPAFVGVVDVNFADLPCSISGVAIKDLFAGAGESIFAAFNKEIAFVVIVEGGEVLGEVIAVAVAVEARGSVFHAVFEQRCCCCGGTKKGLGGCSGWCWHGSRSGRCCGGNKVD